MRRARALSCAVLVFGVGPSAAFGQAADSIAIRPSDAEAQDLEPPPEPRFEGTHFDGAFIELGTVNLRKGDAGFLLGGHIGLGTLFERWLDFSAGARYWSADIDRTEFGDESGGRVKNFSMHPDLRVHLFRWKGVRPYVVTGLTAQFVSADVPGDESLEDALAGFRVGYDVGSGVSSTNRNVKLRVEVRREFADDIGNWTFTAGLGTWPVVPAKRAPEAAPRARAPTIEQFAPVLDPSDVPSASLGSSSTTGSSQDAATIRALRAENLRLREERDDLRRELATLRARRAAPTGDALSAPSSTFGAPSSATSWIIAGYSAFPPDGALLTDAGRTEVRRIAEALLENRDTRVVVEGHTESSGDALRDLTLSEERAAAVRLELIRLGIDSSRVRASGFGGTVPLSDDETEDGRRRNQRVEVRVVTG